MKIWHWIVLTSVFGVVGYRISLNQPTTTTSPVQRSTQVVVVPVKREDFKADWQAVGRVVAKSSVELKPRVEGQIARIFRLLPLFAVQFPIYILVEIRADFPDLQSMGVK